MRFLLIPIFFTMLLFARGKSSMQLPTKECMKARYGYAPGGTLHARWVLQKRLSAKMEATLPRSRDAVLKALRVKYPKLKIDKITFIIRNCKGYYRFKNYYFDPLTDRLIKGN